MEKVKELYKLIKDKKDELSQKNKFFKWFFIFLYILFSYSFCYVITYSLIVLIDHISYNWSDQILKIIGFKDVYAIRGIFIDILYSFTFIVLLIFQPLFYILLFSRSKPSIHPIILPFIPIITVINIDPTIPFLLLFAYFPSLTQRFYFHILNKIIEKDKHVHDRKENKGVINYLINKKEEIINKNKYYYWLYFSLRIIISYTVCFTITYYLMITFSHYSEKYTDIILNIIGGRDTDSFDGLVGVILFFIFQPLIYIILFSRTKPSINTIILPFITSVPIILIREPIILCFFIIPLLPLLTQHIYFLIKKQPFILASILQKVKHL